MWKDYNNAFKINTLAIYGTGLAVQGDFELLPTTTYTDYSKHDIMEISNLSPENYKINTHHCLSLHAWNKQP